MNDGNLEDLKPKKKKKKQQQQQEEATQDQPAAVLADAAPVTPLDEGPAPEPVEAVGAVEAVEAADELRHESVEAEASPAFMPLAIETSGDGSGRGPWLVAGAAALVAIVAVALAVMGWLRASDARDDRDAERDDRSEAAQVAGQFVQALLTYDSEDPAASLDELESLATDEYREQIEVPREAVVPNTEAGESATIVSQVDGVFIRDADADTVEAVGNVTSIFTAQGQSLPVGWYVRLDLKREGGEWKVNEVIDIFGPQVRSPGGADTDGTGGATSTTTTVATTTTAG